MTAGETDRRQREGLQKSQNRQADEKGDAGREAEVGNRRQG